MGYKLPQNGKKTQIYINNTLSFFRKNENVGGKRKNKEIGEGWEGEKERKGLVGKEKKKEVKNHF